MFEVQSGKGICRAPKATFSPGAQEILRGVCESRKSVDLGALPTVGFDLLSEFLIFFTAWYVQAVSMVAVCRMSRIPCPRLQYRAGQDHFGWRDHDYEAAGGPTRMTFLSQISAP